MKRALLPLLMLMTLPARSQTPAAPATPAPSSDAAPAEPPAAPVEAPAAEAPAVEDDPYLLNYKKFEHRDERTPGRGPQGRKIGFGLTLGRPLGFTAKIYFTQTVGFQVDVGTTYSWQGPEFSLSGHVVWHPYNFINNDDMKLSVYVGGGVRGSFWPLVSVGIPSNGFTVGNSHLYVPHCSNDGVDPTKLGNVITATGCQRPVLFYVPAAQSLPLNVGLQGLAGLDLQLGKIPLELYVQPVGTVEVFPGLSLDVGAQVGARWYFF